MSVDRRSFLAAVPAGAAAAWAALTRGVETAPELSGEYGLRVEAGNPEIDVGPSASVHLSLAWETLWNGGLRVREVGLLPVPGPPVYLPWYWPGVSGLPAKVPGELLVRVNHAGDVVGVLSEDGLLSLTGDVIRTLDDLGVRNAVFTESRWLAGKLWP